MERWIKKIKREIKRSPAKAAVLGGLALVAVAIWGYRLVAAPRPASPQAMVAGMAQSGVATPVPMFSQQQEPVATIVEESQVDLTPWQVLQAWRAEPLGDDTALRPARDPFFITSPATSQSVEDSPSEARVDDVSPETLGLRFTGVVIANNSRAAIVENRLLWEGSAFKVQRNGRSYIVRICEVTPTVVKLSIDGTMFEQSLPELGLGYKGIGAP